ncbi:MAG TPA: TolC family outer membrane protein [Stellaceae bacterium]|jgi:adhesin transport system outer membrane protein
MVGWRLRISSGVAVAALLAIAPAHAQSLSDTVRTSVSSSPRVESMIHNRESVDAEMRRAKGLYLPQLDVRGAIGPEYTDNILTQGTNGQHMRSELGAVLAQKLYDGGAVAGQVDHERGRSKSAAYRIRENAEFTGLDAVEAHLDVVRFRHVFQYAQDNVRAHQDLLSRVQQRSNGGAGRAADVAQAQSRLDLATATRDETRGLLEDAEARYLNVVGVAPAALEDAPVPTGAINNDINAELAQLQAQNPTIKAREADIEAAQGLVEQADARFDPTVSFELSGDKNRNVGGFPGRDNEARALLVLRWNLYAGGADIANRQSAYAQVAQAKTDRLQALRDAEQNLRQSQSAYNAAVQRMPALQSSLAHSQQVRDAYDQQFQIGQRTLLDLLDAQNEVFQAQTRLATAQGQAAFNAYRILAVEGMLLGTLNVPPPAAADPNHAPGVAPRPES